MSCECEHNKEICGKKSPVTRVRCSLPQGHTGIHQACDLEHHKLSLWEDSEIYEQIKEKPHSDDYMNIIAWKNLPNDMVFKFVYNGYVYTKVDDKTCKYNGNEYSTGMQDYVIVTDSVLQNIRAGRAKQNEPCLILDPPESKIKVNDKRRVKPTDNPIPMFAGRPDRLFPINDDDICNIQITLHLLHDSQQIIDAIKLNNTPVQYPTSSVQSDFNPDKAIGYSDNSMNI